MPTNKFDFSPTTLLKFIKERRLSVPRYQRSYSWDEEEISDYWSDITKAQSEGRDYFLGTVVLSSTSDSESQSIIDGQQRISTTTILLAAIRDALRENGESEAAQSLQDQYIAPFEIKYFAKKGRIRLNTADNPFYESLIIGGESAEASAQSHKLIQDAKRRFDERIRDILIENPSKWQEKLSDIVTFLEDNARIVAVTAPSDADAFTIFETLNDRGADLTVSDLLKNYLFSQSGSEIDFVQDRWIEATAFLEQDRDNAEFVSYLKHFWSSFYGATRERDLYRSIRDTIRTQKTAVEFSKDLSRGAKLYIAILNSTNEYWNDFSPDEKRSVNQLISLGLEQNRPLLLAVLTQFPIEEVKACVTSLISWSIRGVVTRKFGGGQAERYFCDAAVSIRKGEIKDTSDLRKRLQPLIPKDSEFKQALATYSTNNSKFARYLLLAIEQDMRGKNEPEMVPNDFQDEVNLEHILAQRAKVSDWRGFTADEIGLYAYRLGNMTLLRKSQNNRIGNLPWREKKPFLEDSEYEINKEIVNYDDWNAETINARQERIATRGVRIWAI